jgi:hypothetical protein
LSLTTGTFAEIIRSKIIMKILSLVIAAVVLSAFTFKQSDRTSVFVDELNSHRTNKVKIVRSRDVEAWAMTLAGRGRLSHDKWSSTPAHHTSEICLGNYEKDAAGFYELWYGSPGQRKIMMDEKYDYVAIGVEDGYKMSRIKGVLTKVPTGMQFAVARFWTKEDHRRGMLDRILD